MSIVCKQLALLGFIASCFAVGCSVPEPPARPVSTEISAESLRIENVSLSPLLSGLDFSVYNGSPSHLTELSVTYRVNDSNERSYDVSGPETSAQAPKTSYTYNVGDVSMDPVPIGNVKVSSAFGRQSEDSIARWEALRKAEKTPANLDQVAELFPFQTKRPTRDGEEGNLEKGALSLITIEACELKPRSKYFSCVITNKTSCQLRELTVDVPTKVGNRKRYKLDFSRINPGESENAGSNVDLSDFVDIRVATARGIPEPEMDSYDRAWEEWNRRYGVRWRELNSGHP